MSNNNYDEDFELEDQEFARRQQLLKQQNPNAFNISDEDDVEEQSSTTGDEESSSVASIAKAAASFAPKHHLGESPIDKPSETPEPPATTHSAEHSFSDELHEQEAEEEKEEEEKNHRQQHLEEEEEEEGGDGVVPAKSAAAVEKEDNLDDSLNDQVKEMYDYFKEHVADEDEDEVEEEVDSSLNASGEVPIGESSGNQEHLATIMGDVLRVNKAVYHAAEAAHLNDDSHHDDDGYDKIERSEVKMINEEDELDKSADSLSSSSHDHHHHQHHHEGKGDEHEHEHEHGHEHEHDVKIDSLASSQREETSESAQIHQHHHLNESAAESDLDRSVTDALRVAAKLVDFGAKDDDDDLNESATSSHRSHDHHRHETEQIIVASAPADASAPSGGNNKYDLSDKQINDVVEFYNKFKVNELLSRKLLRPLMSEALASRQDVLIASESDVDRALEAIDRDQDDKITLDEFIELLLLFFSSKHNLSERLESVLRTRAASGGDFTPNDAIEWTSFLNDFYGKSNTSEDLFNALDLNLSLQPDKLVSQLAPKLASAAFVSWERKRQLELENEQTNA